MKGFLLDTTEVIDILRGEQSTAGRVKGWIEQGLEVGICAIVITETLAGVKPQDRAPVREFLETLRFHPITLEAAAKAGEYLYDYARKGVTLSLSDATIAAVAVTNGLSLVTKNQKHYPMPELILFPPEEQPSPAQG